MKIETVLVKIRQIDQQKPSTLKISERYSADMENSGTYELGKVQITS